MNILMVGPSLRSSNDGVIIRGIDYLLKKAFPNHIRFYKEIRDTQRQTTFDFASPIVYDLIVVCGTPWLWDSLQNSDKFKNLMTCFQTHNKAKKVFMGIGTCLFLKDINSDILLRPEEADAIKEMTKDAAVIVRDHVANDRLNKIGVNNTFLPCPSYFCYDKTIPLSLTKEKNILVFQNPARSISCTEWQDKAKLDVYYQEMRKFQERFNARVYCKDESEKETAITLGFKHPIVFIDTDHILDVMRDADRVLSGRVHCAIPAKMAGADVKLIAIDSRCYTFEDFKDIQDFLSYEEKYLKILKNLMLNVGTESKNTFYDKQASGFFDKYMSGQGLDIGFAGYKDGAQPILPTAIGIDKDYPGYNGINLPFPSNSKDYVYSSHCLEHINNYKETLKEWLRVLKVNGYLVIVVPHQFLYEKKKDLPSRYNEDHKRFYTPAILLKEVEESLTPNTYRVRLLEDGDKNFNYKIPPEKHSSGQYEITLVLQKINKPEWDVI